MIDRALGRTNYGQAVGILMLETAFQRIPGDIGNATTFSFPVSYKTVKGASPERVVKEADPDLIKPFAEAARELEAEGVRAITTSCGFLAIFQKELAAAVDIPLFSSSLIQARFAYSMLAPSKKIGIITARAGSLTEKHFSGAGISDIPKVIVGTDETEFSRTFFDGRTVMDAEQAGKDLVLTARGLVEANPDVGAIVLECTNMPPYAKAIQEAVQLPVFDIVTLTNYVYAAVVRNSFKGFL